MFDLSKLPVSKRFRSFLKHKDQILDLIQNNPKLVKDTSRLSTLLQPSREVTISAKVTPMSDTHRFMTTPYGRRLLGSPNFFNFIACYLRYQMYADEINNAVILYTKQDAIGRLDLGRTEKEIIKICKRNNLESLYWPDLSRLTEEGKEIIYSSVAMKYKEKTLQKTTNNGLEYEGVCRRKLDELGYSTSITKQSGDFGCDILAEKEGITYAIQCKSTAGKVGVKAVQEAATARKYYKADVAVVITNGEYTSAARELAVENKVIVLNDNQIASLENLAV